MRAIIIDDELPSLSLMRLLLERNPDLEVEGAFSSAQEALSQLDRIRPDVVFADIEMPEMNGIQFAQELRRTDDHIQLVFVTAYEQYALQAFGVNAVNYILKPVTDKAIRETVVRLHKNLGAANPIMERNTVRTFGTLEVYGRKPGEEVKWPAAKVQELFSYLLCQRGIPADKWKLCDLLWQGCSPERAEHSLHTAVYRLKSSLRAKGIENAITCSNGRYSMNLNGFYIDFEVLSSFFESNPGIDKKNIAECEIALSLYSGGLFGDMEYPWAKEDAVRMKRIYMELLKKAGQYHLDNLDYPRAQQLLLQAVQTAPSDESAALLLMRIYQAQGNRSGMLTAYRNLCQILESEMGILPGDEVTAMIEDFAGNAV